MKDSTIKSRTKKIGKTLLVIAFWLLLWQVAAKTIGKELLLPSIGSVVKELSVLSGTAAFWLSLGGTTLRIQVGFFLGLAVGFIMGALAARFSAVQQLFSPILRLITATPVASFIVLALVWISPSKNVPIFITFLMVLPVVWNNIYNGIKDMDSNLVEMVNSFGLSFYKKVKLLYLPSLYRYIIAAVTLSVNLSWKAGVAAEVLALPKYAIGTKIYDAKIYLETPSLFAWTASVIVLSFLFERLTLVLLSKIKKEESNG